MAKRPSRAQLRQLWSPKRSELPVQCASCPFHVGNDAEFSVVLRRLAATHCDNHPVDVDAVRERIRRDVDVMGDFACHHTAYDTKDMSQRPAHEQQQCPGATAYFKRDA